MHLPSTHGRPFGKPRAEAPEAVLDVLARPASRATTLASLAVTLLVVGAFLAILLKMQYRQTLEVWAQRQSSVADDRVRLVSNWLRERRMDAEANAGAPEVISFLLKGTAELGNAPRDRGLLSHLALLNHAKESYGYVGIYVLNASGHTVGRAIGSRSPVRELEAAAIRSMDQRSSRLEWSIDGPGRGSLYMIAPVFGTEGRTASREPRLRPLGAVALVVNPFDTLFPLLTAETVPSASGETVIVSRSGGHILYVSPLRAIPGAFQTFPDDRTHAAHLALKGVRTFGRFVDYRGASVLAAVRAIPGTELGLVAQIDYDEAFADFTRYARVEAVLAALSVLAIGGWLFGYRRQLASEVANLREAEFRALLESTPEGLVILNAADQIMLVNPQTEKLFGYRRDELLGRSVAAILLGEDWNVKLREGRRDMAGAMFETTARRKDGSVFACELFLGVVDGGGRGRLYVAIRDLTERNRIESTLETTAAQYAALFNGINDAAFVFCFDDRLEPGNFAQVNEVACKMLGYTREELLRRSARDIHSAEQLRAHLSVRQKIASGAACVFETVFLTRAGESIPVEISARTIDLQGRRTVLSVARDISERKRSFALLEESERRYRRFIERNASAFISSRIDGKVLECNDSVVRLLGYASPAEFKQVSLADMYVNADERLPMIERLKKQRVLNGWEVRLKRKDGNPIWALVNLTLVTEGDDAVVEGTIVDITERKRIETELRTIESLVQRSSDFIGYASPEGEVLFVNQAGRELIGVKEDRSLLGTNILDHIAPEEHQRIRDAVLPAVMRDGVWVGESLFRNTATGALIPMWQSAFCITEPGTGRPIALATIGRDLTERKKKEDQLRDAQQAAEAGNLAKSRFLASMSHEIRTPMNGILGMAGLLLAGDLPPAHRHYVEVILSSGTNLLELINQILDLSKIEAGKVVLEKLDFELVPLLRGATEALAIEAGSKGLGFGVTVEPALPRFVRGDPARLRQVMVNLAGNAVKFTSDGSVRIAASVESREERALTVRFTVSDTGIGISPEHASQLFSPFVQGDCSTTRKYGGTGLGLSVSRQIVDLMGGRIGFDSEPGRGSHFWFTVPLEEVAAGEELAPRPPAGAEPAPQSRTIGRQSARILAAEDHPVNREVLMLILERSGCKADIVENGAEAVKALQAAAYDLVLMDCEMPVMDGYQATKLIRDPHSGVLNPKVPVVAVTASAMAGDRDKCFAAGMDDYLPKPIEPESLLQMIDKWLGGTQSQPGSTPAPARAVPGSKPVFDYDALLQRLMGNRPAAQRVTQAFLQAAPSQLANLREHLAARDAASARRDAHTLKGSAATISALALREVAVAAEQAAATCSWGAMEKLMPEMEQQLERLRQAIAGAGGDSAH